VAEAAYGRILSLPIFPSLAEEDVRAVTSAVTRIIHHYHA
jgi:dTDP-4-amino-4,6-dideoxygalactose transaminase